MITVYHAISSTIETQISLKDLLINLPAHFRERALRYQFSQDAYNFVLGRLMIKKALGALGLPEKLLNEIVYNKEGKPLMKEMSFSISHSKDLVACAFAPTGQIGLDVEYPRKIARAHFRHCFNDREWASIQGDTSMHTFYQFWTQKEAILKANGAGLGQLLNIDIKDATTAYFYNSDISTESVWNLNTFEIGGSSAYACLCTDLATDFALENLNDVDALLDTK
ncbi:4'-phosphopantetheinyl transferase superfamily protein [Aureispira sp. CCB-E]|uniref:4'-phosphopantetheinyl transferase family protein n=1 Tax=Aureispira sp. CCB-E TaxID=3051121 RepID=UPI0028691679|nr:4'-phosphopantetheinyl transferase superfamily protein [Aureispira sp. CCB-E]WMX12270.1 4'-phosphopantetheinyl transferase superfamily protein [Aureispira sp. CCB-E]